MRKLPYILSSIFLVLSMSACSSIGNSNSINHPLDAEEINKTNTGQLPLSTETEDHSEKKNDIYSLIPSGWRLLSKEKPVFVEGDLNKDGLNDAAAVIEKLKSEMDGSPQRALIIAFRNKDNSYKLSIIADQIILKADEGGIWGDPFDSISIDRGSVVISHYGGSNWRWSSTYRFRFQDNDWYLIGATTGEYFIGNAAKEEAKEQDYNLLTGDYMIKETNESGTTKITHGNRRRKEMVKLKDFNSENLNLQEP